MDPVNLIPVGFKNTGDILTGLGHGNIIVIQGQDFFRPHFQRQYGQDTRAGSHVQDVHPRLDISFRQQKGKPGGGVEAAAEGHTGFNFYDYFSPFGFIILPGRAYNNILPHPFHLEEFLPRYTPVLIVNLRG